MSGSFVRRLGLVIPATVAILLVTAAGRAQIPCGGYEVTAVIQPDPCPFTGFPPTIGTGLSDLGHAVGYYRQCNDATLYEAFVWTPETGLMTLDRPPGYVSAAASDIDSARGWIVGSMEPKGTNLSTAALWVDGVPIDLGTLPGGNFSKAHAISDGRIVGTWGNNVTGDPGLAAFLWEDGQMLNIHADLGTPRSEARDITVGTEGIRIVGWMGTSFLIDSHAYIWHDGVVADLGVIPGGFASEGLAISADGGTVVGVGRITDDKTGDDFSRAFYWANGEMINLGTLPGFNHTGAFAVNDDQTVVGGASQPGGSAFIWSERDRRITDLNDLIRPETGVDTSLAYAIDNQGQIIGVGYNAAGDVVGLLLTPIQPPVGDLNWDCQVGILDLLSLLADWGIPDSPADLNNDGIVNVVDLLILLGNWS